MPTNFQSATTTRPPKHMRSGKRGTRSAACFLSKCVSSTNTPVARDSASAKTSHLPSNSGESGRAAGEGYRLCWMPSARVVRSPITAAVSAGRSASYSMRPSTTNSKPNNAPEIGVPKTEPKPPATPGREQLATQRTRQPQAMQ